MPELVGPAGRIHFEWHGRGEQIVVFSHGLLWSTRMFEAQIAALAPRFRCLAFDHPGQGRSAVPRGRAVTIETAYQSALALLEREVKEPCHFVGLSMGGFVALRLAIREPRRLRSLVLMATAADPEPPENVPRYRLLNAIARCGGLGLIAPRVMPIMFGTSFLSDPARAAERERWRRELVGNRRRIYRAVRGVIEREGVADRIAQIATPTLILRGDEDAAIGAARAEALRSGIPGARLVKIPRAGHTLTVENPSAVNAALRSFLLSE